VGGPIPYIQRKGKLFFFAGAGVEEVSRGIPRIDGCFVTETFPTAAEAAGNFTDVLPPAAGKPGIPLATPAVIPASCGGVLYTAAERH